jgi:hypothetical protein
MKLAMAASAAANSTECIAQGSCKPLGGYSVWSALPPLPAAGAAAGGGGEDARPIILVVAQMDSIDMFHDSVQVRREWSCNNVERCDLLAVSGGRAACQACA